MRGRGKWKGVGGRVGWGADREIKSITIDSVCETVGADGRQQSDRERCDERMKRGCREENE